MFPQQKTLAAIFQDNLDKIAAVKAHPALKKNVTDVYDNAMKASTDRAACFVQFKTELDSIIASEIDKTQAVEEYSAAYESIFNLAGAHTMVQMDGYSNDERLKVSSEIFRCRYS